MHRSGTFYYFTIYQLNRGHRGRDRMIVEFATTYSTSVLDKNIM
jgi:hypothetical protein